jgi:multiple sugar transport system substrate-binding protein
MGADAPLIDIPEDQLVPFEMAVLPVPQVDPDNMTMISQGPSVCIFNKQDPQEVLASWLFTQYLLTNEVQIAYSQTEGYLPVTEKALESEEYQDYLSREGEDNDMYFAGKIQASKLLLDNIDKTFVTPVFNGSTSLRNAAGQMIENVTKHVRRKGTVDDEYIQTLYADVTSLYRLDQITVDDTVRQELGELPKTAVILLGSIGVAWVCIICYVCVDYIRKKSTKKQKQY